MPSILNIVHRLFPQGTSLLHSNTWTQPPFWPPDAFAVAATLVNLSGCYALDRYSVAGSTNYFFTKDLLAELQKEGSYWAEECLPTSPSQKMAKCAWNCPTEHEEDEVTDIERLDDWAWRDAAITLLYLADVASSGVGFYDPWRPTRMGYLAYQSLSTSSAKRTNNLSGRPNLIYTLGWLIDLKEAVVQPKSRTPQVGCTIRSLTHNLCLLPPIGEIRTSWRYGPLKEHASRRALIGITTKEPLNLLLVPFPFHLDSTSFIPGEDVGSPSGRFFDIRQDWLKTSNHRITPDIFGHFLLGLIEAARKETRRVHGIILPEAALNSNFAKSVATLLAKRSHLELFVTGATRAPRQGKETLPVNEVRSFIFHKQKIFNRWTQSKHHRWKLDAGQIRRYHLGDALDHQSLWWEHIDLKSRECMFYVFRHGASMASLVCEDLARIDPVQTVLRAVGPNLLIVLLMDGPQLEKRWPGRYATVLADDPGSAVLTLTSLGMIRRSRMPGEKERREIALWKEPGGEAKELTLPDGCHALLATLSQSWDTNYTLDGRPDGPVGEGGTMHLSLTGIRGVTHPDPKPWVDDKRRVW